MLDFDSLFQIQRKFDERFSSYPKNERIAKKMFALLVEQGEVGNESPSTFKFWMSKPKGSAQKNAEKYAKLYQLPVIPVEGDPLLEELVDQLHFILSIGNELSLNYFKNTLYPIQTFSLMELHMHFARALTDLYFRFVDRDIYHENYTSPYMQNTYERMVALYLGIVEKLGYSLEQLESAYYKKNQINKERQQNGY